MDRAALLIADQPRVVRYARGVEYELLLACARTHIDTALAQEIRALLQREIDWRFFGQLASDHQVAPLVGHTLCTHFSAACPAHIVEQFRTLLQRNTSHNLFLAHALTSALALFSAHRVRAIAYKGPILAASTYGNLGLRSFADLDLLVHPWDYHFRVAELLLARGWSQVADYGFERTFKDASRRVRLDVHQSLTPKRSMPFALDFDRAWRRGVDVPLSGATVKTFAPSDLLLVLCVQIAKDMGDDGKAAPLIKICDVAEWVRAHPQVDWNKLLRYAARLGALRMVLLGLAVAQRLLGAKLPPEIAQRMCDEAALATLVDHVEECVLGTGPQGHSRPELLQRARWHGEVRERVRERDRWQRALFYFAFAPNRYDYEFVRLPRVLRGLYCVVRPLRLAYKYGSGLVARKRRSTYVGPGTRDKEPVPPVPSK